MKAKTSTHVYIFPLPQTSETATTPGTQKASEKGSYSHFLKEDNSRRLREESQGWFKFEDDTVIPTLLEIPRTLFAAKSRVQIKLNDNKGSRE